MILIQERVRAGIRNARAKNAPLELSHRAMI